MRPYRYVLTALVIAGFGVANGPSLAQHRTSGKSQSYLKQVGSIKIVRQRFPSRRVLDAPGPDLVLSVVSGSAIMTCVGSSTLQIDLDVLLLNIGDAPATLMQSPWAAWLRLRDSNWNAFSPFDLDEFVGPPPSSVPNGQFAKFHISRKLKQDASGKWGVAIQADPYNWIVESNKDNNAGGYGSIQSVCQ
jgi:hypothetical protein